MKIQRLSTGLFSAFLFFTCALLGQDKTLHPRGLITAAIPQLVLPEINTDSLRTVSISQRKSGAPLTFARAFDVDVSPGEQGIWQTNAKGMSIWQLCIVSKGAFSLNLGFDEFELPAGAALFLYDPAMREIQGPVLPADNEYHDQYWSPVLPGDELVLELQAPADQRNRVRLHLSKVNHDFMGFHQALSGSCNLDVVCGAENGWGIVEPYRDIIRSVGAYSLNGTIICTGFLVNNARQDCRPYFMSANHCGITSGNAPTMVVYWNYQNNQCRQPNTPASGQPGNGSLATFNSGAIFRAAYAPSDFALVELDDPVNPEANAYFAGWNAAEQTPADTLICVHHPNNQEKRISFSFTDAFPTDWGNDQPNPAGTHMIVPHWNVGTTEGGSSGSPLFDKNGLAVGQLHGGFAACGNQGFDYFGRLYSSWAGGNTPANSLRSWLDPDFTQITQLAGRSQGLCGAFVTLTPSGQALCHGDTLDVDVELGAAFGDNTLITLTGLPSGAAAQMPAGPFSGGSHFSIRISGNSDLLSGEYQLNLHAADGVQEATGVFNLQFAQQPPVPPQLISPAPDQSGVNIFAYLDWTRSPGAGGYDVQVAADELFGQLVFSTEGSQDTLSGPIQLSPATQYFWRVRANNACGVGAWSAGRSFTTGNYACSGLPAVDTPVGIDAGSGNVVAESRIPVEASGTVAEISIKGLDIEHSWIGDLSAELISPQGTVLPLFDRPGFPGNEYGCDGVDMLVGLNDNGLDASLLESACDGAIPAISGVFQPLAPFSILTGEPAAGDWVLRVKDHVEDDGGHIRNWTLMLCTTPSGPDKTGQIPAVRTVLYPNPVTERLYIRGIGLSGKDRLILVRDALGRELDRMTLPPGKSDASLNTTDWLPGIYWVSIRSGTGSEIYKVMKF